MKINKEVRQLSREMLRASFTDGQLDSGRIASLVDSLIARKPRNYTDVLKNYRRLLRLEVEKRHARIETVSEVDRETSSTLVANLKKKYGSDLTTEFVVNPQLLGGMRIRVGSDVRSEEHTAELQSQSNLVCRPLLEEKQPLPHAVRHSLHRDDAPSPRLQGPHQRPPRRGNAQGQRVAPARAAAATRYPARPPSVPRA